VIIYHCTTVFYAVVWFAVQFFCAVGLFIITASATMPGAVIETLSTKKLCAMVLGLLLLEIGFIILGGLVGMPICAIRCLIFVTR